MATTKERTIESSFKDLFWELMPNQPFDVNSQGNINNAFKKIYFYRDENYELRCRLEANIGDDIKTRMQLSPFQNKSNKKAGVLSTGDNLTAKYYGLMAEVKGFHFSRMDANQDPCSIEGSAYQLHITSNKASDEVEFIHYWYLNGLGIGGSFCRSSSKEFKTILKLKIDNIEKEIERSSSEDFSIDCMRLSINNKAFIFGHVNKILPNDTPCSYLRFSKENLPSKEELEIIEGTLSFIFGKIFMFIGYSKFSSKWLLIERFFQDPYVYGTSLEKIIKLPTYKPFIISRKKLGDSETVINKILDAYSKLNKTFLLDEVVEAINMFRLFPLDLKILPLSVALDIIKDAWFKSDKSFSKGKHLVDDKYQTVISKYLPEIIKELKAISKIASDDTASAETAFDKTTPIINRIKGANNLSNNERIQVFFSELGLKISDIEARALQTRNIVVHGSTKDRDDQEFIDNVHIYYTLLNKVILKLLSYDGFYLDYGTHDYPQRHMTLPITASS